MREEKIRLLDLIKESTDQDEIEGYKAVLRDMDTAPAKYQKSFSGVVMSIKDFAYKCLVIPKGSKGYCTVTKNGNCEIYIKELNQSIYFASEYFLEKSFYWTQEEKK